MSEESLFHHRAFMRLWHARLASVSGSQMLMVALGWQMYDLTGSAWDLGLVGLLQFLPALALVLVAGQVVDRHHRARILALCQGVMFGVAAVLMLAAWRDALTRELLLALSVVLGAVRAFQMPAQQALVPALVPMALLPRALAFSSTGLQGAIIGGPALGGLLYAFGAVVVYATCALCFVVAAAMVATLRYDHAAPTEAATWHSMLAGFTHVWRRKVILGAVSFDFMAVLLGGATALLPMFAKDILQVGPWGLGLLRSAPALGALVMSIWLTRYPLRRHAGPMLFAAVAVYGVTMLVFGLSTSFWLSLAALAIGGAADMISVVVRQTLVQLETPDAMRGRVSSVNSLFIGGSNQLGEFESGATAAWLGPVGSVLVGGAGTLVVVVLWWFAFPQLSRRDALLPADHSRR